MQMRMRCIAAGTASATSRLVGMRCSISCGPLGKSPLALLERRAAQVFAAEFKQVEGEQDSLGLRLAAVAQPVEYRPSSPQITTSPSIRHERQSESCDGGGN